MRGFRVLVFLLAWQMVSVGYEIAENLIHVVLMGHTAHGPDDARHQEQEPEHGCSGTVHFCHCHSSPSFTEPTLVKSPTVMPLSRAIAIWSNDSVPENVDLAAPFRPPIG